MNNPLLINVTPFKGLLTESKTKPGVFEVVGIMQRAGAKNQNGRIYKREILEDQVREYIENFVKVGNAYGELDHPESAIVSLKNASHIVRELWWEGDELMGRIELLNTPSGNIAKAIVEGGYALGISSRGTGSVQQTNEGTLMVQDDFELVAWDLVSNPSTQNAFMKPISLNEGVQSAGKYVKLDSIINNILRA
jgi:hypothetical protein